MIGCSVVMFAKMYALGKSHNEPLFNPNPELLSMTKKDWEEITEDVFKKIFKDSAVKRTKFSGLKRNIQFLKD